MARRIAVLAALTSLSISSTEAQNQTAPANNSAPAPANPAPPIPPKPEQPQLPDRLKTIQALLEQKDKLDADLLAVSKRTDLSANDIETERKRLQDERSGVIERFQRLAANVSAADVKRQSSRSFDLSNEVSELAKPALEALKQATERPRRMEQLRTDLDEARTRETAIQDSINTLKATIAEIPKGKEHEALRKTLDQFLKERDSSLKFEKSRADSLALELAKMRSEQNGVWESVTVAFKRFFLTRGRNLLFALLAATATFFLLRWSQAAIVRFGPWHKGKPSFARRLFHVLFMVIIAVGTTLAGLSVLYVSGDWLLLGLALVVLLGLALAAKHGLPRFYRHARLLMNLGEVREGERIVYQGVPWLVKSINIQSHLTNPVMRGDGLRLPLEKLVDQLSRPHDSHEPWFPCQEGDWVMLADGTHGKAVMITPEFVQLVLLGGARKTYSTPSFITQCPLNISTGFRIRSTFAVDYKFGSDPSCQVTEILQSAIKQGLESIADKEGLRSLKVELKCATPSWIDYEILADFDGKMAEKHNILFRAIQSLALDASQRAGWSVPLPQVIHRVAEAG